MMNKNGFTIIEVSVVIAIIATISAVALPVISTQVKQSKIGSTKAEMLNLKGALLNYYEDVYNQEVGPVNQRGNIFPRDTDNPKTDLAALEFLANVFPNDSNVRNRWSGPYIESASGRYGYAEDSWGTPYDYDYTMGDATCSLRSAGPNRSFGDSDDIPESSISALVVDGNVVLDEKIKKVKDKLQVIKEATPEYFEDNGSYPNTIDVLVNNGYIQEEYREDEWGNKYVDKTGAGTGRQMFISIGPDGDKNRQSDNIEPY